MTSGTVPQDVKDYLSAVRARLDDLPAEERDDLLADVESSMLESAGESDAPVELRLGPPNSFADELRAAAGLPPRAEPAPRPRMRERLAAANAFFATGPSTGWLRELAPLWWVLRGLVAAGLVELLIGKSVFGGDGSYTLQVVLGAALAVTVSVAVGLRSTRRTTVLVVVNLVLALAAVPVIWNAVDDVLEEAVRDNGVGPPAGSAPSGLVYDGAPVENVYAFDRAGRLLQDVRLFSGGGEPLEIGAGEKDPNRRRVRTRNGELALNAFPIRYFEPGTKRVAKPGAGTPVRPGPLVTEPLGPR